MRAFLMTSVLGAAIGCAGPGRVDHLIADLKASSPEVREHAARELGALGDEAAVEPLVACLKDEMVHVAAKVALAKLGEPAVLPLIACLQDGNVRVWAAAADVLGNLGDPRAIEPLMACLKTDEGWAQWSVVRALAKMGAPAVGPLIPGLKDVDWRVRWGAVTALQDLFDPRSIEPLIACLQDENAEIRSAAVCALWRLNDPRAVDPLIASLNDPSLGVRMDAAGALGSLGDARAVEPLILRLEDESSDVRGATITALGLLGDARSVTPLIAYWRRGKPGTGILVSKSLVRIGEPAVMPVIPFLKAESRALRAQAAETLGQLRDARSVEPLISCLKDGDALTRVRAVKALAMIGKPAVKPLEACQADADWRLRDDADAALRLMRDTSFIRPRMEIPKMEYPVDPRTIGPLVAQLKDAEYGNRESAARTLARMRDARAVEPLVATLNDHAWLMHLYLLGALDEISDAATQGLIRCVKDGNSVFRLDAALALGELREAFAVRPLMGCLWDSDQRTFANAVWALGEVGDTYAVPALIACLKSKNATVRANTVWALGQLGDVQAVEPLVAMLPDWALSRELGLALERLGYQPKSDQERIYLWICARDNKSLETEWDLTERVLLADAASGDARKVLNAVYTFACLPCPDVVSHLVELLNHGGDVSLAEACLTVGEPKLQVAAQEWAKRHAVQLNSRSDAPRPAPLDPLVAAALNSDDQAARSKSVAAIGKRGNVRDLWWLVEVIRRYGRSADVVAALIKMGDPIVKPLIPCLADEDQQVRLAAAEALGELRDPRAIEPLIASLKRMGPEVMHMDIPAALAKMGEPAIDPLIAALKDGNQTVRWGAAMAFWTLHDARAVPPLIECLKDDVGGVRTAVTGALCLSKDPRAVDPLIACLKDQWDFVRISAVDGLGDLGDGRAVEPLIACLKDSNPQARVRTVVALGKLGDARAAVPLVDFWRTAEGGIRDTVSKVLVKIGAPAVDPLISCLKVSEPWLRIAAIQALEAIGDVRAVDPLKACVEDADAGVRGAAASALENLGRAGKKKPE